MRKRKGRGRKRRERGHRKEGEPTHIAVTPNFIGSRDPCFFFRRSFGKKIPPVIHERLQIRFA
jgi:hypothetical protein